MAETTAPADRVIRVMPEALANKIAAGEVVQRPASVAKELIENALDAGASDIQLIIKKAGRALVQVVDDGCGMNRADAEACFRRHATSKIRAVEDLERLQTLGFRGEALASIAAVSQVELRTRALPEGAAGTRVVLDGGEVQAVEPCAAPGGTSVAVRNLFFNVPVRRNFLKSPATEFKHLAETFQQLALSNPSAAFTLVHNDREVYRLGRRQGGFHEALRGRISDLFGADRAGALVPLDDASSYLSVRGFAGAPEQHRRIRGEQFLFVNGRYVSSHYLAHAVRTAYGNLLPEDAHPFFALFLRLDPRRVDVNVHPTKAEVKFDDKSGVYGFLRSAVRAALGARDLVPQFDEDDEQDAPMSVQLGTERSAPSSLRPFAPADDADTPSAPRRSTRFDVDGFDDFGDEKESADAPPGTLSARLYAPPSDPSSEADEEESAVEQERRDEQTPGRPLWQLKRRYLVTENEEGLLLIDQHAAHKRVLYERALRQLEQRSGATQHLLFPETIDLPAADAELLGELLPDLEALGFDLELFSGRTVALRGVPADLRETEARALLEEVLSRYRANGREARTKKAENLARSVAGRGAIRAGRRLTPPERQALVADLLRCEMPYADPQGRPTMTTLPVEELAQRFG